MLSKEHLLDATLANWQRDGSANWREETVEAARRFLAIRVPSERVALVIAESSRVACSNESLVALALECSRLGFNARDDGLELSLMGEDQAALFRGAPITKSGGPRFASLEVADFLDDFLAQIAGVIGGNRGSVWLHGSDEFGFPEESDLLDMVSSGRYTTRMLWLLQRYSETPATQAVLRHLVPSSDIGAAAIAMTILFDLDAKLDIERAKEIASDVTCVRPATLASKLLAKAVGRDPQALEVLFELSRDQEWLSTIEPSWAKGRLDTREELLESILAQRKNRFRREPR